jgi:hypothetical protein
VGVPPRGAGGGAPLDFASGASAVHEVQPGRVDELAAGLADHVGATNLVALGGGRVIDVAKAIAAVGGGRVAAIPTTLSGAEMTGFHRLPAGRSAPRLTRAALVIAAPAAMTSLPEPALRASAMNALSPPAPTAPKPSTRRWRTRSRRSPRCAAPGSSPARSTSPPPSAIAPP